MPLFFAKSERELDVLASVNLNAQAGGYVDFVGRVRIENRGRAVDHLYYEAYCDLAKKIFADLEQEARSRFGIIECQAVHRLGLVKINEKAVAIMVGAAHRSEAFAACRFLIDELKSRLPIWKKETYQDGSHIWDKGLCECSGQLNDAQIFAPVDAALVANNISPSLIQNQGILLVGAGGLGCPLALNLAGLGIKNIHIYDGDVVSKSNLARQYIYSLNSVGQAKVLALKKFLHERFLGLNISAHQRRFEQNEASKIMAKFDLVIDGSDCAATKDMLKAAAFRYGVPLISASVYQAEGDVQVFLPSAPGCLLCYKKGQDLGAGRCQDVGVLTHACSMLAAYASHHALNILAKSKMAAQKIILVEPGSGISSFDIPQDKQCQLCSKGERSDDYTQRCLGAH